MLRDLSVQNLALIEDVRVELRPGFCAWTGETGAGKSLLLGALGLLLGERGSSELIRAGADELRVTGRFELSREELRLAVESILGSPAEDDEVILSRRLSRAGRSSALVNEHPVALATLRKLGEVLVDVHGQRDSHSLLQPSYQLELLDAFGKLTDLRHEYVTAAEELRALRRRRRDLDDQREARQRELSLIRFEREELEAAALKPGELDELAMERERLANAQSLIGFTSMGAVVLYDEEGSVSEQVGRLYRESEDWTELDPRLKEFSERLASLVAEVRDLADTARDLSESFESDPARLDEVDNRIEQLRSLQTKYRKDIDELIRYRDGLNGRESELQQQEDDLGSIDAALDEAFARLREVASRLSKQRKRVAKKLAKEAQGHLAELGMSSAILEALLEPVPLGESPTEGDIPSAGTDTLELLLAANPGEPALPLRKVASGGEMARTMLALKTVLAAHDPVGTLVFDEIDANVGGRLGDVLGQKLAILGRSHQVICVTHLPQVAAFAADQWTIRKQTKGKRTTTSITHLSAESERVEELASMLRGESRGETTRREAAEMLRAALRLNR